MEEGRALSLEEIRVFLEASEGIRFEGKNRKEIYGWVKQTLVVQQYEAQGKAWKGLLRSYLSKMRGCSRAQVTGLIGQYLEQGNIEEKTYHRRRFPSLYTRRDSEVLGEVDEADETLSGPATQKILYREFYEFGNRDYQRLAQISMAHIYNLRKSGTYRKRRIAYQATRPTAVNIGERRKPDPHGRPGYLPADTGQQGDPARDKGGDHT